MATAQRQPKSGRRRSKDATAPTPLDFHRYRAHRAGQSVADLAAEAKVSPDAIEASLRRVRIDNVRFSPEATGIAVRRMLLDHVHEMDQVFSSALAATRLRTRDVIKPDPMTGELKTLSESEEYPDHDTRLKAIDTTRALIAVVQPKDPAVVVTSNSQTNILNQAALPGAGAALGLTSPEAVIRAIRAQRGLALTDGAAAAAAAAAAAETHMHAPVIDAVPADEEAAEELDEDDDDDGDDDLDEDEDDEAEED